MNSDKPQIKTQVDAWGSGKTQFFYQLDPVSILKYIDQLGLKTTGRCLPLNSLENRVYEIEIDNPNAKTVSENFVIAKFYRPGRWSREQILDEHEFLFDLVEAEIPAIPPLQFDGESLFQTEDKNLYYCVFPKRGGRNPDEFNEDQLRQLGRLLGRLHLIGQKRKGQHRVELNIANYGTQNLASVLADNHIPENYKESYDLLVRQFINVIEPFFKNLEIQRVHGDCHKGNILFNENDGFFFIDFDDFLRGPVVQDLWTIIPGRDQYAQKDKEIFLEAYELWKDFPHQQLKLIEPLRGLRTIHFDAWIGKRWSDPAFPQAFPHFTTDRYWAERIIDLREQIDLCQQLTVNPYGDYGNY